MAISNTSSVQNKYAAYENTNKISKEQSERNSTKNNRIDEIKDSYVSSVSENTEAEKKNKYFYGNTIGNVKLSDEASSYYEELKKKYSNLNFVLVSSAEKNNALAKASKFNNGYQITAVIDEEQLERMATDPEYRKKMEDYIDNAVKKMNELNNKLDEEGLKDLMSSLTVKINDDGTISYFAVLKDMAKAQKERIEDKLEEKKEEKAKERAKERLKAYEDQMQTMDKDKNKDRLGIGNEKNVIKADSIDDLIEQLKSFGVNQ